MSQQKEHVVDGIDLFTQAKWNRSTVADGKWLQNETLDPISANDRILASAIYNSSAAIQEELDDFEEDVIDDLNEITATISNVSAELTEDIETTSGKLDNKINELSGIIDDRTDELDNKINEMSGTIDDLTDVVDVVGTLDNLANYNCRITKNDVIKVLSAEGEFDGHVFNGTQVYFRYMGSTTTHPVSSNWSYVLEMDPYYSTSDVDEIIENLSGIIKGDYVPLSAVNCSIGSANTATSTAFAQGYNNKATNRSFAQGIDVTAYMYSLAQGNNVSAYNTSLAQGNNVTAYNTSFAQGNHVSATYTAFAQGSNVTALNNGFALGREVSANGGIGSNPGVWGADNVITTAGTFSIAYGNGCWSSGWGRAGVALGNYCSANQGFAWGSACLANSGIAMGQKCLASGNDDNISIALGNYCTADKGIAIGSYCSANQGFTYGSGCTANSAGIAMGIGAYAEPHRISLGDYPMMHGRDGIIFNIGDGDNLTTRKDLFTLDRLGELKLYNTSNWQSEPIATINNNGIESPREYGTHIPFRAISGSNLAPTFREMNPVNLYTDINSQNLYLYGGNSSYTLWLPSTADLMGNYARSFNLLRAGVMDADGKYFYRISLAIGSGWNIIFKNFQAIADPAPAGASEGEEYFIHTKTGTDQYWNGQLATAYRHYDESYFSAPITSNRIFCFTCIPNIDMINFTIDSTSKTFCMIKGR